MPRPRDEPQANPRAGLSLLLRPAAPPAEDGAALKPFAKAFAAVLAETLAARFGMRAGFAPDDEGAVAEPGPGLVMLLAAQGEGARVEIGQSAIYDLVDAMFGGDGAAQPYRDERRPSELERALIEGLAPAFAYALGEALARDDLEADRVVHAQERDPDAALLALRMRLIGRDSRIALALPRAWLGLDADEPARPAPCAPAIDALDIVLSARWRDCGRALSEIVGLGVGDVLKLAVAPGAPAIVETQGVDLFEATLGRSAGRYSVRLDRRLSGAAPFFEDSSQ
jgi:hypothetical protein